MLIFQKNFNTPALPAIKNPQLSNYVQLPQSSTGYGFVPSWQEPEQQHAATTQDSQQAHNYMNSSHAPNEYSKGVVMDPMQLRLQRQRASETNEILRQQAVDHASNLANQQANQTHAEQAKSNAAQVDPSKPLVETDENVPIIDTTLESEPATTATPSDATTTTTTDVIEEKTTEKFDNIKDKLSAAKTKAGETLADWSDKYGSGVTGSLAKDAALAAGGLALAGGAYKLLKKRKEKKRAEKEALNNRVKK